MTKLKYSIIYADPAWKYRDKAAAGKRGCEFKYSVMDDDDICALPVKDWVADDAVLILWATWPKLFEALQVINAWGFKYKTCAFLWVKLNPLALDWKKFLKKYCTVAGLKRLITVDAFFLGMGNWTRANTEFALLAVRGKPKRQSARVRQLVIDVRREHSRKPDEVRDRIVELCGDVPRLEMFARTSAPGWDVWGNEVEKFD